MTEGDDLGAMLHFNRKFHTVLSALLACFIDTNTKQMDRFHEVAREHLAPLPEAGGANVDA